MKLKRFEYKVKTGFRRRRLAFYLSTFFLCEFPLNRWFFLAVNKISIVCLCHTQYANEGEKKSHKEAKTENKQKAKCEAKQREKSKMAFTCYKFSCIVYQSDT